VIGGGAGGVELLLSLRSRLLADVHASNGQCADFSFALVTAGEILAGHNRRVKEAFRRVLAQRGILLREHSPARSLRSGTIMLEDGSVVDADAVLVTTDAAVPAWFHSTDLALDGRGFIAVGPTLQTLNDADVFAAGDCAALVATEREKAGVFAVRAGPPLAQNLRRRARGKPLKPWRPQRRHLALISTGERYAIASRGVLKGEGGWLWSLKDWIDRRWMRTYQDVEAIRTHMSASAPARGKQGGDVEEMRCGGCAAKIGPAPLSRALARLRPSQADGVVIGLDVPDDAAVITAPSGKHLVQSVDFFRAFIDDPYVFGEIAANHALNDIFAMGGTPRHALATAVVPPGPAAKVEEALFQVLAGARACLDREGVELIGGHSSEGADLAIGFTATGVVDPDRIMRKGGLRPGDVLVLTKPLGTGILFAAAMRARAEASWVQAALSEMRRSNRKASEILVAQGGTAMTDITGFGLAGHLGEMLAASTADAELDVSGLPLYAGVPLLAREGVTSTLLRENLALAGLLRGEVDAFTRAVLFDPQTSGGLLAGIPADRVTSCLDALRSAGYRHAAAIGRITRTGLSLSEAGIGARAAGIA